MTIAACYPSSEGVVFGADSTTTMLVSGPEPTAGGTNHYFNHAKKIFQIGEESTLGITMWGLGSLGETSHRTLIAEFADELADQPSESLAAIADRWNEVFWTKYRGTFPNQIARADELNAISADRRTSDESSELILLTQMLTGGFCLGGYCRPDRAPGAFEITFRPTRSEPNRPQPLSLGETRFWGCPNIMHRLLYGVDFGLLADLEKSPFWTGEAGDLIALVLPYRLAQPFDLPIREAIDWVYTSIYTTSQAMKFSHLPPVCGGPVEVAVVTTDRKFRWVRHKSLDTAVAQGASHGRLGDP